MKKRTFIQTITAGFLSLFGVKAGVEAPESSATPHVEKVLSARERIGWGSMSTPLDRYFTGRAMQFEGELNEWFRSSEELAVYTVLPPIKSRPICFENARMGDLFVEQVTKLEYDFIQLVKDSKLLGPYMVKWCNVPDERENPLCNIGRFRVETDWRVNPIGVASNLEELHKCQGFGARSHHIAQATRETIDRIS